MIIIERLIVFFCLISTAIVTIETSKKGDDFGAASNCANAKITNQVITVNEYGIVIAPSDRSFLDFGLPTSSLMIATQTAVSGTVNRATRDCTYSLNTTSETLHVYSCSDNGTPTCQISFTPF